ncbi:hypothetical protein EA71_02885 [Enterococcus durans]|uniref:Uncharacterized protein n=1 Tax=Enterococcus durans TaxID=53345 RepID=A0A367CAR5_9ENTE|nr:hypothetical protein EA71_02885 [Enterococcus durans]
MFLTFVSTSFFLKFPKKTGFWTPFISEGVASATAVYSRVCRKPDLESVDRDAFFRCSRNFSATSDTVDVCSQIKEESEAFPLSSFF